MSARRSDNIFGSLPILYMQLRQKGDRIERKEGGMDIRNFGDVAAPPVAKSRRDGLQKRHVASSRRVDLTAIAGAVMSAPSDNLSGSSPVLYM